MTYFCLLYDLHCTFSAPLISLGLLHVWAMLKTFMIIYGQWCILETKQNFWNVTYGSQIVSFFSAKWFTISLGQLVHKLWTENKYYINNAFMESYCLGVYPIYSRNKVFFEHKLIFLLCRLLNSVCDTLYVCCADLGHWQTRLFSRDVITF